MVIKIYTSDENDAERLRCFDDDRNDNDDFNDSSDNELGFYGIFVKKQDSQGCPYNKNGEYIPRSKRR